jgi:hypothetical protein
LKSPLKISDEKPGGLKPVPSSGSETPEKIERMENSLEKLDAKEPE